MPLRATSIDLTAETLTLALCVRVERADGTILGFTSHDRDLVIGGVTYEALSSVQASAVRQELGSGVDNLDVIGLLSSEAIAEADLRAGLYDGAGVRLFLVDWSNLGLGDLKLLKGMLGEVTVRDGQFVAELRSLSQRLSQQICDITSVTCRVRALGDAQCGVTIATYQFSRTVYSVVSRREMTFDADTHATGYYDYGKVAFSSGANNGLSREIKSHTLVSGRAAITLQEPLPYDVAVGNTAVLTAGCDRRLETCRDRFGNVTNFRGEPHVPGVEALMLRGTR